MKTKSVLQILGAGRLQKKTIKQAEESGIEVVAVDFDKQAEGKGFATYKSDISTLDYRANLSLAKKYNVDGILTTGTDQPVLIAAKVADRLHLPSFISVNTALLVTNKEKMKAAFRSFGIPSSGYRVIKSLEEAESLRTVSFPLVIKPVDSQGQRGVFLVDNFMMLKRKIETSFEHSKSRRVIVENYIEGPEITANVWVDKGRPHVLMVTDRIVYNNLPNIGLCLAHIFPSRHAGRHKERIERIIKKLVMGFEIYNGPVYIQMIISEEGPFIGEVACRVGGGHEEDLIPVVTGFDIRRHLIDYAIGRPQNLREEEIVFNRRGCYAVFFVGAKKDTVADFMPMEQQVNSKNFLGGDFYVRRGMKTNPPRTATDRIGYFLVKGKDRKSLLANAANIYSRLTILGKRNLNIIEDIFQLPLKGM
jgi:biotin carboxylase